MFAKDTNTNDIYDSKPNRNNFIVIGLFITCILFQLTGLKYIWSLEGISRFTNIVLLLFLIIYVIKALTVTSYSLNLWKYYLIPGILIVAGMFLNISFNVISNFSLINFYGLTLPWLTYLIVPELMQRNVINSEKLWKYFYYFMLWACLFGFVDYYLAFFGEPHLNIIKTPHGLFYAGYFSIFVVINDGLVYYRYLACFLEPGTLAMFLLPAITYAFFHKKYAGLLIFLFSFYLCDSLGGDISLLILVAITASTFITRKKKYYLYSLSALFIIFLLLWSIYGGDITKTYESKGGSAAAREENFVGTIINFPALVLFHPFGIKLAENTYEFEKNKLFVGSEFIIGTYLQYGGISSLIGILLCLYISFKVSLKIFMGGDLSREDRIVFISIIVLFPFIFQRSSIWDSSLFALLFAPNIIREIEAKK